MTTPNLQMTLSDFIQLGSVTIVLFSIGYGLIRGIGYLLERKARKREEYFKSFDAVVAQLSSNNSSSQLAAAVLLRRYFDTKQAQKDSNLRIETINVISAMLKVLPVGVFQKTLGDSLAYAMELSRVDLQRVNLQDVYLGIKNQQVRIVMYKTDLFMADLSYALLEHIDGHEAIFYNAILFNTRIKDCDFSYANFRGADLKDVQLTDVVLKGADFTDATNIPSEITTVLENGVVKSEAKITTIIQKRKKQVFFSMPGNLSKQEETITKEYKRILEAQGYTVVYYQKDDYPEYGQFTRVRESLLKSSAVIAFGFHQTKINDGILLPGTSKELHINDKWLNTPWNEIEVGMALMQGLPVLLVKDDGIDSGIFDKNLSECFVATIPVDFDCRDIETNQDFINWCNQIQ
ncbi:pentapeptide repeat-containing protein [bacterium]|nr:pentapeptide repeat-containing protein [bacterium]